MTIHPRSARRASWLRGPIQPKFDLGFWVALGHLLRDPIRRRRRPAGLQHDRDYLQRVGVLDILQAGEATEIAPMLDDLAFLHRQIVRRRPQVVLEFGVGFSTLTMAHALNSNHLAGLCPPESEPRLYCVDSEAKWIANVSAKVPLELQPIIEFQQSDAGIAWENGELCHFYETLPDMAPDFIYLDAPGPWSVQGAIRGLTFHGGGGGGRSPVAADILLYESTLRRGAFIVVDGRRRNVRFLRRNLKRKYRFRTDRVEKRHTFELLD